MFHTDSVLCGLSALALKTNAPTVLKAEALSYPAGAGPGAFVMGPSGGGRVAPEKAVVANCSAVREWDSVSGTTPAESAPCTHDGAGELAR